MKESAMTMVSSQEAIEGYVDGRKRHVVSFD